MGRPRLTGGAARGRVLAVDVPASARPTSSRVREALFSVVGHDLSGLRVLDAFGGSGLLGLEAWSRGAQVVIVEQDRAAVRAIRANARGLQADVDVRAGDVLREAQFLGQFDGVLADPPYAMDVEPVLSALAPVVAGWLVLETDDRARPAPAVGPLALERRRCYGSTVLWLYRREG